MDPVNPDPDSDPQHCYVQYLPVWIVYYIFAFLRKSPVSDPNEKTEPDPPADWLTDSCCCLISAIVDCSGGGEVEDLTTHNANAAVICQGRHSMSILQPHKKCFGSVESVINWPSGSRFGSVIMNYGFKDPNPSELSGSLLMYLRLKEKLDKCFS